MAVYRQAYDFCHLRADCPGPGSTPDPYARVWDYVYTDINVMWNSTELPSFLPHKNWYYFSNDSSYKLWILP